MTRRDFSIRQGLGAIAARASAPWTRVGLGGGGGCGLKPP
jgi:hypothetical protein